MELAAWFFGGMALQFGATGWMHDWFGRKNIQLMLSFVWFVVGLAYWSPTNAGIVIFFGMVVAAGISAVLTYLGYNWLERPRQIASSGGCGMAALIFYAVFMLTSHRW